MPGAGQLWTRGDAWLLWVTLTGFWFAIAEAAHRWAGPAVQNTWGLTAVVFCLASAEYAKRALEPRAPRRRRLAVSSRVRCKVRPGGAVRLTINLVAPIPVDQAWEFVSDVENFLRIDPFHSGVKIEGGMARPGARMILRHCAFGVCFARAGRMLWRREGREYAFSDLSTHDARRGFPHIFVISAAPAPASSVAASQVTIEVRGKWTARWAPRWLVWAWLTWVSREHARLLRQADWRPAPSEGHQPPRLEPRSNTPCRPPTI